MSAVSPLLAALAVLPERERRGALEALSPNELDTLQWHWPVWARADQLPPDVDMHPLWRTWLLLSGRGAGKTRSMCEWVRSEIESGRRRSIAVLGPTSDTVRRDIVQGPSGLLAVSPPAFKPVYEPSQRRVVYSNGAIVYLNTSEEPDRLRGGNYDSYAVDELTSLSHPEQCWSNLQLACRITGPLGDPVRGVIATTPKRHALLKSIMTDPSTVTTRARTLDNSANLDSGTLAFLTRTYGGTTLGRQELDGELLEDLEGALWTRDMFDKHRVQSAPALRQIVVAVDPAGGSSKKSDETGIAAVGLAPDKHLYVLRDVSGRYSPDAWARRAVALHDELQADRIVCEANFGGEMVLQTIKATGSRARIKMVTASRGKQIRAEPVVSLYEQGRVHHVGNLSELEDQCCGWEPLSSAFSPDRLDALVWACTELSGKATPNWAALADAASLQPGQIPASERWRNPRAYEQQQAWSGMSTYEEMVAANRRNGIL